MGRNLSCLVLSWVFFFVLVLVMVMVSVLVLVFFFVLVLVMVLVSVLTSLDERQKKMVRAPEYVSKKKSALPPTHLFKVFV